MNGVSGKELSAEELFAAERRYLIKPGDYVRISLPTAPFDPIKLSRPYKVQHVGYLQNAIIPGGLYYVRVNGWGDLGYPNVVKVKGPRR